jgi:NCAIR mutase (PurE)-related protein
MSGRWGLFDDLNGALTQSTATEDIGLRPDVARERRAGIPEVVYAGHKQTEDVILGLKRLVDANGRAVASRCNDATIVAVEQAFAGDYRIETYFQTVVVSRFDSHPPTSNGTVGLLTAGTSDNVCAAEANAMLREMGTEVVLARDVGVAGLHRLVEPLKLMADADVDAIIVAAGMDGALPSVVAGLVPVPVIGLPVSTGYGLGGRGEAALYSMLQSCAPGLAVVNIDNGIGAAATAGLIARRAAAARRSASE